MHFETDSDYKPIESVVIPGRLDVRNISDVGSGEPAFALHDATTRRRLETDVRNNGYFRCFICRYTNVPKKPSVH